MGTRLLKILEEETAKEFNNRYSKNLSIVPEYGGRSPTDFMILDDNDNVQIYIEHEKCRAQNFI